MKNLIIIAVAALVCAGCKTAYQSDKITVIRQRVLGIVVETAATESATPTPNIKFGWCSTEFMLIPTSTNGNIATPNYVATFDSQTGASPFSSHIIENSGSGNVMLGTNGQGGAVIPKEMPPTVIPRAVPQLRK